MAEENQTTETVESTESKAEETTETTETKVEETPTEDKVEETKEPELTLESYGDLGLKDTDDIKIDADLRKSFTELALKNKLSPEAAKEIAALQIASKQKEVEAFKKMQEDWNKQNMEKYGDNLKNVETNVARVLTEFDKSGEFAKLLDLAGAKSHPATLAFLKSLGDQVLEKASINASATSPVRERSLEDFY